MSREKVILVTVSDDRFGRKEGLYELTQKKIEYIFRNNDQFGINDFLMLNWANIEQSNFYKKNKSLLKNTDAARNGRAYKPYVISEGLKKINEGDFLIYTDCSPEMWSIDKEIEIHPYYNIEILKKNCEGNNSIISAFVKWDTRPILKGCLGIHTHENFTTNRCMKKMQLEKYSSCFMHASGMLVIQKLPHTVQFVKEWLYWNCIDECASLGRSEIENDYSFWDYSEEFTKMGHRHDQSISGLLINKMGNNLIDIIHDTEGLHTYNFLNFSREDKEYEFINPNKNPDSRPRIKKGDVVINSSGQELRVFEIRPEKGIEWLIVGAHRESCYQTTEDKIKLKI
jgi:hypothetical protein